MRVWWTPRYEDGIGMQPCLSVLMGDRLFQVRFGFERHRSFTERYQGTRGIPKQWRYLFGERLSFRFKRLSSGHN